jgi:hypothetical protein
VTCLAKLDETCGVPFRTSTFNEERLAHVQILWQWRNFKLQLKSIVASFNILRGMTFVK